MITCEQITSEQLKSARLKLGEDFAEFAQRFGVNRTTAYRWETFGVPDRPLLQTGIRETLKQIEYPEGVQ